MRASSPLAASLLAAFALAAASSSSAASTGLEPSRLAPSTQSAPLAVRVDSIVLADGTLGPGGWLLVRNGRIESIGASVPPPGSATLDLGGVATAGFIDPATALGAEGDLAERARAFTPEVVAADAFAPDHSSFRAAARGGITTVGLSPESDNVIGGRVAVVRTSSEGGVAELTGNGPMRFTLADRAFQFSRAPTSRMGALPKLRELLATGTLKAAGPSMVDAETADEIRVTLETFGAAGQPVALLHPFRADDALELIKGKVALAIVGPLDLDSSLRDAHLPKLLADAAVPIAFTAGGDAGALRVTAAIATRSGLDPKLARQALTSVAARALGIEGDSGTLEPGKRADLIVLDGDPLDLSAKVKLVLVGGVIVDAKKETP